jgi:type VI secretion system protein ImpB
MSESKQHWLDRNRPPRVQITYDVETGGAIEKKEIPFVVGVLSDLSGQDIKAQSKPKQALKDRKFIEVDRDNFADFMKSISPTINIDGKPVTFETVDDFHPDQLVEKVEKLQKLLDIRKALNDLLAKADGNDDLIQDLQNNLT